MHIDRALLFSRLEDFIRVKYIGEDKNKIIELVRINIFNDPTHHCIKRSCSDKWNGLPASKSLFHSPHDCGLPIGNLTSQIFANFYMDKFDHYLKHDLGIRYYGRYVDDFVIIHQDHRLLKDLIGEIKSYLCKELHVDIHPKKVYLQHYTRGVPFLGTIIKPGRIYIGNRTKSNFFQSIARHNEVAKDHRPTKVEQQNFLSSMNSYLGILKHYNTYNLRKKILWKNLSSYWWNLAYVSGGYAKLLLKTRRSSGK